MDVKTAICKGDADELRRILSTDSASANALVSWGPNCRILTHPLHYVSDMLFNGVLPKGKELPLIEALLKAGGDVDFHQDGKGETPLIGAASLGAEDVGLRLLDAGAQPHLRGDGGETALHWAALFGEYRLARRLIEGADLELEDARYHSTPLGWAVHGYCEPPAQNPANHGHQREVAALLVEHGAKVRPEWLQEDAIRVDPEMLRILQGSVS
jgi:ankyrin repeat protein